MPVYLIRFESESSVDPNFRKWELGMKRWMEAYRSGLGVKETQKHVKTFRSRRYTFHRRIPKAAAGTIRWLKVVFKLRCYYIMAAECLGEKKYIYSSVLDFRRRFVPTRDWGFELNLNLKSETVTETRTRSFGTGVRYS